MIDIDFKFSSSTLAYERFAKNCPQLAKQAITAFQASRDNYLANYTLDDLSEEAENQMLDNCILVITKSEPSNDWKGIMIGWIKRLLDPNSW